MTTPAANIITKASIPTKIYQHLIKSAEPFVPKKLQPLWNHPAGWWSSYLCGFLKIRSENRIKNIGNSY